MTQICEIEGCGSDRIAHICGKCSDLVSWSYSSIKSDGEVPSGVGIGGGDYIEFDYCLNCGQIQQFEGPSDHDLQEIFNLDELPVSPMTDPIDMLILMRQLIEYAWIDGVDEMEDSRWVQLVNLRHELEEIEILPEGSIDPRNLNFAEALALLNKLIEEYS